MKSFNIRKGTEFDVETGTSILTTSDIARHLHVYTGDNFNVRIED